MAASRSRSNPRWWPAAIVEAATEPYGVRRPQETALQKRSYTVRALWDPEAKVYYSDSDIVGLHIEAATLEDFEALMTELAPELVIQNHLSQPDLARKPLSELLPLIIWEKPQGSVAA